MTSDWDVVSSVAGYWVERDLSQWLDEQRDVTGVEIRLYHPVFCRYEPVLSLGLDSPKKQRKSVEKYKRKFAQLILYGACKDRDIKALLAKITEPMAQLADYYRHLLVDRMVEMAPVVMYQAMEIDGRWVLVNVNKSLSALTGEPIEVYLGSNASKVLIDNVHPEDVSQLLSSYDFARATTREMTVKYRVCDASGQYIPVTEHVKYADTTDVKTCTSVIWPRSWEDQNIEASTAMLEKVGSFIQDINFETGQRFLEHFVRRVEASPRLKSIAILARLTNGWWECRVIERETQLHPLFVFQPDKSCNLKTLALNQLNTLKKGQPEAVLLGDCQYFSIIPLQGNNELTSATVLLGSNAQIKPEGPIIQMIRLFSSRILKEIRQLRIAEAQVEQNRQLTEQTAQLTGMVHMLGQLDTAINEDEFIRQAETYLHQIFPVKRIDWFFWTSDSWWQADIHAGQYRRWFEICIALNDSNLEKLLETSRCSGQVQTDMSSQQVFWPVGTSEAGYLIMVLTLNSRSPGMDLLTFSQNAFALALSGLQQRENLRFQAMHDSLTGLGNRVQLHAWMKTALPIQEHASLLLFDLNRFKEINDSFGHQFGDKLLQQIGPRIRKCLDKREHYLARLGGDEFTLFFPDCLPDEALELSEKIHESLAQTYLIDGLRFQVGASVGVAHYPAHGRDGHELLRCTDVAMYAAKSSNRNVIEFNNELDNTTPMRIAVLSELDQALEEGQLWVAYQPIMHTLSGVVVGLEALVRWSHPLYGNLSPTEFIPIAEMGEGIRKITDFVLNHSLRRLNFWREIVPNLHVAINISPQVLLNHQFPDNLNDYLKEYCLPGDAIVLELTESTLLVDPKRAVGIIKELGSMGIQLEIDDFGTGYSSLSYLKSLPLSALKIDRSFVTDLVREPQNEVIVASTVQMAHSLGLKIIAEGVEDEATLLKMTRLECDMIQGYYFARPIPAAEVDNWLVRNR